jgi:sulfonate transport system ATP-binding protein
MKKKHKMHDFELAKFMRRRAVPLAAYAATSVVVFCLQGALLPKLAAQNPRARSLLYIAITLVALAFAESAASHAYVHLAPALEEYVTEYATPRALQLAARGEESSSCVAHVALITETLSTIGNFCARFALRGALAVVVLLFTTAYYSLKIALLLFFALAIVAVLAFLCAERVFVSTQLEFEQRAAATRALGNLCVNWEHVSAAKACAERCAAFSAVCAPRTRAYERTCARMRDFVAATLFGCALSFAAALTLALREFKLARLSEIHLRTLLYSFLVYFGVFATFAQQLAALSYNVGQFSMCDVQLENHKEKQQGVEIIAAQNALEFHEACTRFAAFAPLSLQLKRGERVVFVAPSGSGKSSLLRAAALLQPLLQGSVRHAHRESVTYAPQECVLFEATLEENLRVGNAKLENVAQHRFVVPLLERFQHGLATRYTHNAWSAGQRKLAIMLRALLHAETHAGVFLADEPFASLDAAAAQHVAQCIEEATRERAAIVVTHHAHLLPSFRVHALK